MSRSQRMGSLSTLSPAAMTKHLLCLLIGFGGVALVRAQTPVDREILARMRSEAFDRSQVSPVFDMFTVTIGPRLTASPAHKRAAQWARDRLGALRPAHAHPPPRRVGPGGGGAR